MPDFTHLIGFGLVALGMALTPGPNTIYLVSRSICHGKRAGLISLAGIALGFLFYMLCAAFGITAFIFAVPHAYDILRYSGAAYLLFLAWETVRPGGQSMFAVQDLPPDSVKKLLAMGFVTNLMNPKVAVMYITLLPQFISPGHGSVPVQSIALGGVQIAVSVVVNALITVMAGYVSAFFLNRPILLLIQRWSMGIVLAGLAICIAFELRKQIAPYVLHVQGLL